MYLFIYIYICVESTGDCGGAFAAVHVVCCCACGSLFCFHVHYIILLAAASNPIRLLSCSLHHAPSCCFKPDSTCIYTLLDNRCMSVGFFELPKPLFFKVFSKRDGKPSKYKLNQRKPKKTKNHWKYQ